MIVDAHHHFWEPDRFDYGWLNAPALEPIRRPFGPDDLRACLTQTGVTKTVLVQTLHNIAENRWALGLADAHDFIAGVVGWVDLAGPECADQVDEFCSHPRAVGIRHIVQDEPDDDFIVRPDVLRGLKVLEKKQLPFDLLFYPRHLHHVPRLAAELPELPMVIDHLAKPPIARQEITDWLEALRAAARFPNVCCKLSGLVTEANWQAWTANDLEPYIFAALEEFGPSRCMFGSDWPVCTLAGSYEQVLTALLDCLNSISESERAQVLGETAIRFYGLRVT